MKSELLNSILSNYSKVRIDDFELDIPAIKHGIIFLYASWSQSRVQLNSLLASLSDCHNIELFVFDIDRRESILFLEKNGLQSDGWGETFWVKGGTIIDSLKKYDMNNIGELVKKNICLPG